MPRGTTLRNFRANDELWEQAKAAAEECGDDLSAVLRSALAWYLLEPERIMPPPPASQ